jgi:hypothetical protein
MKQVTAVKVAAVAVAAVLIAGGAIKVYFYTSPQMTTSASTGTSDSTSMRGTSQLTLPCGYQDPSEQPKGCWADYLGYLPAGYVLAPHYPNGAVYPCPQGMDVNMCRHFQASCGNGVCDPNESCSTCPIDCFASESQICNSYTGRTGNPTGVCQVTLNATSR